MKFSNTDIFSHPASYYPGVSVFTGGKVLLLEEEESHTELAEITKMWCIYTMECYSAIKRMK